MGDLAASLSAFMATWFTPSSLFIFVNLVILTIAITSRFATPKKIHHRDSPQLVRSPSLLDRVISFNLGVYKYESTNAEIPCVEPVQKADSPQLVRAPSLLERVKSFNLGLYKTECSRPENETPTPCPNPDISPQPQLARAPSLLERLKSVKFYRSESIKEEKEPDNPVSESGHGLGHLVERCRSEKGAESPAPEKMRKWWSEKTTREEEEQEEEGVDAKADDFINRFKEQLRLQRLDSILRYRQMLKGN